MAAKPSNPKTEMKTQAKTQTQSKKVPEVIDLDISSDEDDFLPSTAKSQGSVVVKTETVQAAASSEASSTPPRQTRQSRRGQTKTLTLVKPKCKSSEPSSQAVVSKSSFEDHDQMRMRYEDSMKKLTEELDQWRKRCEETKAELTKKEDEIKQLETKIPNMINEFKKCVGNKDNEIKRRDDEMKELKDKLESEKNLLMKQMNAHKGEDKKTILRLEAEKKSLQSQTNKEKEKWGEDKKNLMNALHDLKAKYHERDEDKKKLEKEKEAMFDANTNLKNDYVKKDAEVRKLMEELTKSKENLVSKEKECKKLITTNVEAMDKLKSSLAVKEETIKKLDSVNNKFKQATVTMKKQLEAKINEEKGLKMQVSRTEHQLKLVKEELNESKQNLGTKISVYEADIKFNGDMLASKDAEILALKGKVLGLEHSLKTRVDLINAKEAELKSAKASLSNLAEIQTNAKNLMTTHERQSKIVKNQNLLINKYKIQTEETNKKLRAQEQKIQELEESVESKNQNIHQQRDELKSLRSSLHVKTEEATMYKSAQEKLYSQIKELELNNSNKVEAVSQLEKQVKMMTNLKKRSVQCVSLMMASQEYAKMIKQRQETHTQHVKCSKAAQKKASVVEIFVNESIQGETDDNAEVDHVVEDIPSHVTVLDSHEIPPIAPVSLKRKASNSDGDIQEVKEDEVPTVDDEVQVLESQDDLDNDVSKEMKELVLSLVDAMMTVDQEMPLVEDIPEDVCFQDEDSVEDQKYPDNMITYSWPIIPFTSPRPEKSQTLRIKTSYSENLLQFLRLNVPAVKNTDEEVDDVEVSTPASSPPPLPLSYNWPIMIYIRPLSSSFLQHDPVPSPQLQQVTRTRGVKRVSPWSQEDCPDAKRFKFDSGEESFLLSLEYYLSRSILF